MQNTEHLHDEMSVTGALLSGRRVSAADFTSIIINPNSTVTVWVETSSNRSGLYFIWRQKGFDVMTALRVDDRGVVLRFPAAVGDSSLLPNM